VSKYKNKKSDTTYFLKIVVFMIVGSMWLKIITHSGFQIPIPFGFLFGLILASHEHFQIDRKIEYAVLVVAMFIGFWVPVGFELTLP
jgi:hypothetical protein